MEGYGAHRRALAGDHTAAQRHGQLELLHVAQARHLPRRGAHPPLGADHLHHGGRHTLRADYGRRHHGGNAHADTVPVRQKADSARRSPRRHKGLISSLTKKVVQLGHPP